VDHIKLIFIVIQIHIKLNLFVKKNLKNRRKIIMIIKLYLKVH